MSLPSPAATKTKNGNGPQAPQSALSVAEQGVSPGDSLVPLWAGSSDENLIRRTRGLGLSGVAFRIFGVAFRWLRRDGGGLC